MLYCKLTRIKDGTMRYGVFKADKWDGSFKFVQMVNGDLGEGVEDPYVIFSKKRQAYHMIFHRQDRKGGDKKPSTAYSTDGAASRLPPTPRAAMVCVRSVCDRNHPLASD